MSLRIIVAYKEEGRNSPPSVIYCGNSGEEADKAKTSAVASGKWKRIGELRDFRIRYEAMRSKEEVEKRDAKIAKAFRVREISNQNALTIQQAEKAVKLMEDHGFSLAAAKEVVLGRAPEPSKQPAKLKPAGSPTPKEEEPKPASEPAKEPAPADEIFKPEPKAKK